MTCHAAQYHVLLLGVTLLAAGCGREHSRDKPVDSAGSVAASGALAPVGPPLAAPARTNAGGSCIIDMVQSYTMSGTLAGTVEIDYRILVAGPCGSPLGTYDEDWIAHGTFMGTVDGTAGTGAFSYVAGVKAGGDVDGRIAFGQGLTGELLVQGNFGDGQLSYSGWVR